MGYALEVDLIKAAHTAVALIDECVQAALDIRGDVLVLCHERTDRDTRRRRLRISRGSALKRILRRVVDGMRVCGVGARGAGAIQTPLGT